MAHRATTTSARIVKLSKCSQDAAATHTISICSMSDTMPPRNRPGRFGYCPKLFIAAEGLGPTQAQQSTGHKGYGWHLEAEINSGMQDRDPCRGKCDSPQRAS